MAPKQAAIQKRAYELWEAAGRPEGDNERFWLQAELELESREYGQDHPQPVSPLPKTESGSAPVLNG